VELLLLGSGGGDLKKENGRGLQDHILVGVVNKNRGVEKGSTSRVRGGQASLGESKEKDPGLF